MAIKAQKGTKDVLPSESWKWQYIESEWAKICAEYGFIIRYQKDKEDLTEIIYEPWHLRYVGIQVSEYLRQSNLCLEEFTEEWQRAVQAYEN